jgi:hypothetical protein
MSFHDGSILNSDPSMTQSSQPSISMPSGNREITDLVWSHCREAMDLISVGRKKTKLVCL